jgi:hypothetical protein
VTEKPEITGEEGVVDYFKVLVGILTLMRICYNM